jgi:hypothetical protein
MRAFFSSSAALTVMAGLVPAIHVVTSAYAAFNCDETPKPFCDVTAWMPGTSPGMTAPQGRSPIISSLA